jgi:hypothetical protein
MKETVKQSAKGCLHRMPDGITALDRLEIKPEREAIRQQKIARRTKDIPKIYRKVYEKAVINGNKPAAIKAFCLECVCWQKNEIINCTSFACPLYLVRPFVETHRKNKKEQLLPALAESGSKS